MKVRFGVCCALALLVLALGACGKGAEPGTPAAPAVTEERSVSVSLPPAEPAAEATPAPSVPAAAAVAAPEVVPTPMEPKTDPTVAPAEAAPPIPEKIARVGDVIITAEEFTRDLALRAAQESKEQGQPVNPDDPNFRAVALGEMIDARVLRSVASRSVVVSDEDLNREFARGRRVVGSEARFQEYLKREGLDEAGLKSLLRDRMAIEAYRKQKLDESAVTEEEIQKLYDQWSAAGRFDRKERTADIEHLGVHPEGDQPADLEKAKKTVEDARARIAAGESFRVLAVEVSDDKNVAQTGGLYPEVSASGVPVYIAERLFKQAPGELSELFEGDKAWHLLKVLSVNEPGKITLEKAHDQIRNYLLESKRQDALTKAIDQAKYLMDIEIYKAELRPKEGPGSSEMPQIPPGPPTGVNMNRGPGAPGAAEGAAAQ
jgi:foldase protein PrsA